MKLLICQSCGVVIRTRGKHCTGCGVQLALNAPTQMPSFSQVRPPLAVSVKQDHLLLERVVTERQLNALTLRPRHIQSDIDEEGTDSGWSESAYGGTNNTTPAYGGNGGNSQGANGNGSNGHGNGNGSNGHGNSGSSVFGIIPPADIKLPGGFQNDIEFEDPASQEPSFLWNVDGTPAAQSSGMEFAADGAISSGDFASGGANSGTAGQANASSSGQTSPSAPSGPDYTSGDIAFFNTTSTQPESIARLNSLFADRPLSPELKVAADEGSPTPPAESSAGAESKIGTASGAQTGPDADPAASTESGREGRQTSAEAEKLESEGTSSSAARNVLQVAGLSSQPGAAISIAIGGGMAGFMAGQLVPPRPPAPAAQKNAGDAGIESGADSKDEIANKEASSRVGEPAKNDTNTGGSLIDDLGRADTDSRPIAGGPEPQTSLAEARSDAPDRLEKGAEIQDKSGDKVSPIAVGDIGSQGNPADPMPMRAEFRMDSAGAKSEVEDFFGKDSRSPSSSVESNENEAAGRKESSSFFGDDDGGFDFFSAPADPASRRPTSTFAEDDSESRSAQAKAKTLETQPPAPSSSVGPPGLRPDTKYSEPPPVGAESLGRPKVAMPKSITQSQIKLKASEEETASVALQSKHASGHDEEDQNSAKSKKSQLKSADDEGDGEEDDKEEPISKSGAPKRRSFSGSGGSKSASNKNSKDKASKNSKEGDEEEGEDDNEASSPEGALGWLEQEITFLGLNVSRKTAGVLIAVGVFILIQVPSWLMTFVKAGTSGVQIAQQAPGGAPGMMQGGAPGMMQGGAPGMVPGGAPGMVPGGAPGGPAGPQNGNAQGAPGQQIQGPIPVVAGEWKTQVQLTPQTVINGSMYLQQSGLLFAGQGRDGESGYTVQGRLVPPNQLVLVKQYDEDAKRHGAFVNPVKFTNTLIFPKPGSNGMFATNIGQWETQVKEGYTQSYFNKSRLVTKSGQWTAQQQSIGGVNPGAVASNPVPLPGPAAGGGFPWNPLKIADVPEMPKGATTKQSSYQEAQHFFLMIAGGLIAIGVTIFMLFLRLFGPGGQMNIWEKEKYIPSQFRSLHMKMVREFGKPLKPGGVPMGTRLDWRWWSFWNPKFLSIPADVRKNNPHILILGGGDKGKTRLMASMVTHDIKSEDRAIVLIDSDGQLSDLVIEWMASQQDGARYAKRVVLVDPTYKAGSLAYNPLEMPEDGDLQAASSAIVHGFKAIYTEPPGAQSQWNAQTANILRNAALLLIANGRTLTDLPMLLQDNDFRDIMLEAVERKKHEKAEYITICETWNQYKKLARTDQWINWVEPILNRVGPMLSDGRIRPILTKPVSDLKLKDIIKQKKILIVKVPQGELDQNANLLGSLMITGLQQAAMSLCRDGGQKERPVALYVDEMDNFIEKETVENLTSETSRFQIGFCATAKTLQHLPEDYRNQLVISMGTMCIFALSKKDGDMLGPQMFRVDGRKIKHQTIQNFFNKVNTSPQFELIMDEEKLNIDRIVGQNERTYFCYRVGTVAGVFKLKAYDFKDIPEKKINRKLVEKMHAITDSFASEKKKTKSSKDD